MTRSDPYCGPAPTLEAVLMQWNLDPLLLAVIAAGAVGLARVASPRASVIVTGLALLAFVSPLCAATVSLLSARSVHHLVVALMLAPALAMALRRFALSQLPGAAVAGLGFAGVMVLWHWPPAYAAAWDSHAFYWVMQAGLLAAATLWWHRIICDLHRPDTAIGAALAMAGISGVMGLIGAGLTFAPRLLFSEHLSRAPLMGLDPLTDQQLAGLVMWVPGAVPLGVAALVILWRSLLEDSPA